MKVEGLPGPNSPYGLCGRKATVSVDVKQLGTRVKDRTQGLCESRGGRPGLAPVPNNPYGLCGRKATWRFN